MWSAYAADGPDRETAVGPALQPGRAPTSRTGVHPVEVVVDQEVFVVSQRADAPGTYDFDWVSHPHGYGFTMSGPVDWVLDHAQTIADIRDFLAEVDPETGYLRD
jgi:hypothetical protein